MKTTWEKKQTRQIELEKRNKGNLKRAICKYVVECVGGGVGGVTDLRRKQQVVIVHHGHDELPGQGIHGHLQGDVSHDPG